MGSLDAASSVVNLWRQIEFELYAGNSVADPDPHTPSQMGGGFSYLGLPALSLVITWLFSLYPFPNKVHTVPRALPKS